MTNDEKIRAWDGTVFMLESTVRLMEHYQKNGDLTEYGEGSLWRAVTTLQWLKGDLESVSWKDDEDSGGNSVYYAEGEE
jgi:hypothetical protein